MQTIEQIDAIAAIAKVSKWRVTLDADEVLMLCAEARNAAEYKRLYDFRGEVLRRPCLKCGYVPVILHASKDQGDAG